MSIQTINTVTGEILSDRPQPVRRRISRPRTRNTRKPVNRSKHVTRDLIFVLVAAVAIIGYLYTRV